LKLLARRELSEAQVRQRLARKGHNQDDIVSAVAQLRGERALDDERVAGAIARTETAVRGRGRARVQLQIERAGVARSVARQAVDGVFQNLDSDELLAAALERRLRGRPIADDRELQRLYRYLTGQGFEPERVLALLGKRRKEVPDG
jgi:regulatory protein